MKMNKSLPVASVFIVSYFAKVRIFLPAANMKRVNVRCEGVMDITSIKS